jgi:hypothetical protein
MGTKSRENICEKKKLAEDLNVTAGTLNPHLPKRTIAARQVLEWLE